jgi:hypothetical protein
MKPGRVPTDARLLFFLLLGHDHLSPFARLTALLIVAFSGILRVCFTAPLLIGRALRMLF